MPDSRDHSRGNRIKKEKRKRIILLASSLFLLAVIAFALYSLYVLFDAVNEAHEPLWEKSDLREEKATLDEPFTVLLLGKDAEAGLADVILVASIDPQGQSMKMLSIPRDTVVDIANTDGHRDKINSSVTYGVEDLSDDNARTKNAVETVQQYLNIPIDYYATVNFQGFVDTIDAIDGIEVNPLLSFSITQFGKTHTFTAGQPVHLNGEEALAYVRMRKEDPDQDAGRNKRQQQVIDVMVSKMSQFNQLSKIDNMLSAVGDNVRMQFSASELLEIQGVYQDIPDNKKETLQLQGSNQTLQLPGKARPYDYFVVALEERQRVSNLLRSHLQLPAQSVEGTATGEVEREEVAVDD
ncbi:LCP family protein [Mechercharimyces sp. CAU 1602]|uniref:LCP family glycopolymer transferase n=1 Tax=Mechercharimyces sp. CAU 1602 TaxID=2973933 RepID=UPI002163726B|nr:LCP family protein [Mechercharimyces sp. CAU 1602]MCS1352243.1 LCP family protein [Mechercharimyces sp. CAU 1602]